jgi:hypothetical protein
MHGTEKDEQELVPTVLHSKPAITVSLRGQPRTVNREP